MTGCDPARTDNPRTIQEQAPIAYENIRKALAAAGATPRDIVQVRKPLFIPVLFLSSAFTPIAVVDTVGIYQVKHYIVKDTGNAEVDRLDVVDRGWGELWVEFMDRTADGHRPPDTVVGVAGLAKGDILYECEVWAVVSQ